ADAGPCYLKGLMLSRPFRAAFALAFASALLAAVATAAIDLLVTWARAHEPVDAAAFLSSAIAALGLYGAFAAFVAVAEAIVAGGLFATFDVPAALRGWLDGV